jgi:nuclear transport factor 2 (NTF2) superfamily protein
MPNASAQGWPNRPVVSPLLALKIVVWNSPRRERNRDEFFVGREAIKDFLRRKWERELDYRLRKELWCFTENRIAVRFEYESRDPSGQWWRSHGNELWEFDDKGLMIRRDASINDYPIDASERRLAE